MTYRQVLRSLCSLVLEEADRNPEFAKRLQDVLAPTSLPAGEPKKKRVKAPAALDPFVVLTEFGEPSLRQKLNALTLEQLLDIVTEFGMDASKLVRKWKSTERVADHIVDSAKRRAVKGNAFRGKA